MTSKNKEHLEIVDSRKRLRYKHQMERLRVSSSTLRWLHSQANRFNSRNGPLKDAIYLTSSYTQGFGFLQKLMVGVKHLKRPSHFVSSFCCDSRFSFFLEQFQYSRAFSVQQGLTLKSTVKHSKISISNKKPLVSIHIYLDR